MIFMGSAGSRIFLICARISADFAAISLPCSACAAVKGGLGCGQIESVRIAHSKQIRFIMIFTPSTTDRTAHAGLSIEHYTSLKLVPLFRCRII